jgi:hypothetical protein
MRPRRESRQGPGDFGFGGIPLVPTPARHCGSVATALVTMALVTMALVTTPGRKGCRREYSPAPKPN